MSNVPKLRFREFSGEWKDFKMGDLTKIKSASRVLKSQWMESGVPFFRTSDVVAEYKGLENKKAFISIELFNELSEKSGRVKKNDLLVTGGGSIGIPYLIKTDEPLYFKDADLLWFKNTDKLNGVFLYIFLLTMIFRKYLNSITHTGTISHYTIEQAKSTPIKLPDYKEQEKIASFLTSVDTKIEQLTKKEELLQQYKKSVMQKIFNQKIRFKADDGSEFPEWEEKKLGDLCKVAKSGGTPTSTNKEYYDGDIPFLAISDITTQGKYLTHTSKTVSKKGIDNSASWLVPENTIIYSMYASVGFVSINKIPLATSQAVINLILKDEANTEFIYYYLLDYKQYIHRFIETGTQGNLNAQTVKSLKINLPCKEEQAKIANFLSSIDAKIEQSQNQLKQTKEFKKALLQQMFV